LSVGYVCLLEGYLCIVHCCCMRCYCVCVRVCACVWCRLEQEVLRGSEGLTECSGADKLEECRRAQVQTEKEGREGGRDRGVCVCVVCRGIGVYVCLRNTGCTRELYACLHNTQSLRRAQRTTETVGMARVCAICVCDLCVRSEKLQLGIVMFTHCFPAMIL